MSDLDEARNAAWFPGEQVKMAARVHVVIPCIGLVEDLYEGADFGDWSVLDMDRLSSGEVEVTFLHRSAKSITVYISPRCVDFVSYARPAPPDDP